MRSAAGFALLAAKDGSKGLERRASSNSTTIPAAISIPPSQYWDGNGKRYMLGYNRMRQDAC
jgi:hypothetical protein